MKNYRYPGEHLILAATLFLVVGVIALTAVATVCSSVLFFAAFLVMSFYFSYSHHQALLGSAQRVKMETMPELAELARRGQSRLQPGDLQVYVVPSRMVNAYTFGLSSPKVVVLYSGLLERMDPDELLFVMGHEMGHIALGHTVLNSLVGGMAGIPASWGAAIVLVMAFLWWNRTCEYSADRAGLLACGRLDKAISALVKLAPGAEGGSPAALRLAYQQIDAEDDTWMGTLSEALGTHPLLIKRIQELRKFAASRKLL
jgi:Zn-dependent protease with chaperone function